MNEKYINSIIINQKFKRLFICLILKERPELILDALVVDINFKNIIKPKRTLNHQTLYDNSNNTLIVTLFLTRLNLEIVNNYITILGMEKGR